MSKIKDLLLNIIEDLEDGYTVQETARKFAHFGITVADVEQILVDYGLGGEGDEYDQFNSDAEADADVLRSAGWGTDEDYGYYGGDEY